MVIGHLELFCENPTRSKEFYQDVLGFEVEAVQKETFVWLKNGETSILLRPGGTKIRTEDYGSTSVGFVLYTDDLDKTVDELVARGLSFKGTDGSERFPTFTDPDGNWFQLVNANEH